MAVATSAAPNGLNPSSLVKGESASPVSDAGERTANGAGHAGVNGTADARQPAALSKTKSELAGEAADLADPANRSGSSPDVQSRLEAKRLEFERQREAQKKMFEEQMAALASKQAAEEAELLNKAKDKTGASGSAPSSPTDTMHSQPTEADGENDAPSRSKSGNDLQDFGRQGSRFGKARVVAANGQSAPGTRRHSGDVGGLVQAMTSMDMKPAPSGNGEAPLHVNFLFDDELEADLNSTAFTSKYLQSHQDDDKFPILVQQKGYPGVLSASSAALDLAPLSQTPPKPGFRLHDAGRTSEWPQFSDPPQVQGGFGRRASPNSALEAVQRAQVGPSARQLPAPTSPNADAGGPNKRHSLNASTHLNGHEAPKTRASLPGGIGANGLSRLNGDVSGLHQHYQPLSQLNGYDSGAGRGYAPYESNGLNASIGMYPVYNKMGAGGPAGPNNGLLEPANRFAGLRLEDLTGDMQNLCRDQHGCRFLQRKLEEGDPVQRDMIFTEIAPIFNALVVDPFANYLAQRMLEVATDEQRDRLVESISSDVTAIAVNMHGTRAIQKMIDFLSTQYQVATIISALSTNVIGLIKDLNGNHVIQKCLNHFTPEDNQFIYNAISTACLEVATHRHGCCVLQRAIDHASDQQRVQLVTEITFQALSLVQDAFGNYVVQYILDIDQRFAEAVIRQFSGNLLALSCQKFSSNVMEKCIRVSDPGSRRLLVDELLDRTRLERLLNDPFGNYVLQTALDYAEGGQRQALVSFLRPMLPTIRNTPHGKRLTQKIQRDGRLDGPRTASFHPSGGHMAPSSFNSGFGAPQGMYVSAAGQGYGTRAFSTPNGLGPTRISPSHSPELYTSNYGSSAFGSSGFGANAFPGSQFLGGGQDYQPPFAAFH